LRNLNRPAHSLQTLSRFICAHPSEKPTNVVTVAELEQILLKQFRRFEACETVEQVTVIARRGGDWIIGTTRSGLADLALARQGAQMLEKRYRNIYAIVQEP